ncbi:Transcriptional activator somA like [Actinidia chinensis var. chinensis]|uniref:Transcriptional activator somA like n=1 Tax=Actinidia chinensis var. chinensis TaxID=1590841 RepID=A0A2R6PD52_ACTCC|nr:Transcriptional activator somA like [Actinidia chinensis var. chinensis]
MLIVCQSTSGSLSQEVLLEHLPKLLLLHCYVEENQFEEARPDRGDPRVQFQRRGRPRDAGGSYWRDEKRPRGETPDISPSKKDKQTSDAKTKGSMPPPQDKKKGSSGKALTKSRATSHVAASKRAVPVVVPREGTLANPGAVFGLNASILENPVVAEKLLEGVIPSLDKEEVGRLDLDREISRLLHGVGQVIILLQVKMSFRISIPLTSLISCRWWCLLPPSPDAEGSCRMRR